MDETSKPDVVSFNPHDVGSLYEELAKEDASFDSSTKQTVKVKISGPLACFTRPECKVERMSYEVITPSASRNILNSVLWKPEMRWKILRIQVLNPIAYIWFKRNEVERKICFKQQWISDPTTFKLTPVKPGKGQTQRNTVALKNVSYVIEAAPLVLSPSGTNTIKKYVAMFNRRVAKGQYFHSPYLGIREFSAVIEPVDGTEKPINLTKKLGFMLYDIAYGEKAIPLFFDAKVENGILDVQDVLSPEQKEVYECSFSH